MKTTILIIFSLLAININASSSDFLKEEFFLEEECYINDIPFNTLEIAMDNESYYTNPGFYLEDEGYIDDIPFNTYSIAANVRMEKAMAVEFKLENEETVNDLPFNTSEIAHNIKDIDLVTPEENIDQSTNCDFEQVNTAVPYKLQVISILMIILMSAYTLAAFLL